MDDSRANVQDPSFRKDQLKKLGLKLDNWEYVVALAGNPNTGKSTVFNNLTGLRQHTGNWPGKTVQRAEGGFEYRNKPFKLVDLPGTYSLLSTSEDEEIARDFLLFGVPDVTVVVVDATRLQRNLALALQILEITNHVVICLNLMDEAERKGITIDAKKLEKQLGVPVVPSVARYGNGQEELLSAVADVATGLHRAEPVPVASDVSDQLTMAIEEIESDLNRLYPQLPNTRWIAIRLLDGDERIEAAIASGELLQLSKNFRRLPVNLEKELELLNALES